MKYVILYGVLHVGITNIIMICITLYLTTGIDQRELLFRLQFTNFVLFFY